MRPQIVLVLVLLLAIAAVVTYFGTTDDGGGGTTTLGPSGPVTAEQPRQAEEPVELENIADDRTAVDVQEAPQNAVRTAPEGSRSNGLTGRVEDEDGNPVEGAEVTLTRYGRNNLFFVDEGIDRSTDRTARTNSKGVYSFSNVPPRKDYSLKVHHGDFAFYEEGNVQIGENGIAEQNLIVLRPGITLSGYVRDTAGNAVADAKVYLTLNAFGGLDVESPDTFVERTNGTGLYEFANVGVGQWTLAVVADGFGSVTVPQVSVTGEVSVTKDITVEVASMIGGRVITSGAEPVVGAQIQAFSLNQRSQQNRSTIESDENGEFVMVDVPEGSYTLLANVPGFKPWRMPRVESGEMGVLIELEPLPTVSGTVLDAGTGRPLTRFTVRLRQEVPNAPAAMPVQNTRVQVRDEAGEFQIAVPKPGNYQVEAVAEGYAMCFSPTFTIADAQNLPGVVVNMTRGGSITGKVLDTAGQPVRGARVTTRDKDWTDDEFTRALGDMLPTLAIERTARTDAQGRFTIEGLTPTEYKLEVNHPDHPQELKTGVFVAEGAEYDAGTIQLRRGGVVAGVVRDPSGNMVAGAVVSLQTAPGSLTSAPRSYQGKTDGSGAYELSNISAGSYVVSVRRSAQSGVNPFQDWQDQKSSQRQVVVVEGERLEGIDFTLGESGE